MSTRALDAATLPALTWAEFKTFLREPPGNIFALAIPLTAMIASGIAYGNVPDGTSGVYGPTDLTMPGQLAAVIAAAGFMVVPPPFVLYRQRAARRAAGGELPPFARFSQAQLLVAVAVILTGTIAVLAAGRLLFDIRPPAAPLALTAAFTLCSVSIVALGVVLGAVLPTVPMARVVGLALFLLNLLTSGSAIPPDQLPAAMRAVGVVMPLTYVRRLLADLWFGRGWNGAALAMVAATFLVSVAVSYWFHEGQAARPVGPPPAGPAAGGRAPKQTPGGR